MDLNDQRRRVELEEVGRYVPILFKENLLKAGLRRPYIPELLEIKK